MDAVRVDKWLWAARFYKTRSLAKQAIDAGHIRVNGKRVKPARTLVVDDCLVIQRGLGRLEVEVQTLSDRRRGAPEAQLLYVETEQSRVARTILMQQRAAKAERPRTPDKKARRTLAVLKRSSDL